MSQTHPTTHSTPTPKQFTLAIVESVVARHPGVTVQDVLGPCRLRKIVNARFEAIAEIAEARPHWSYPTIGRLFGGRDHTTIMHALNRLGALKKRRAWKRRHHKTLSAVRSISDFILGYEVAARHGALEPAGVQILEALSAMYRPVLRARIAKLWGQGLNTYDIAKSVGIREASVYRFLSGGAE